MKQQKCFLYAYSAGVIDSDGSIFLSRDKLKSGHINHKLQVKVGQTRSKVVNFLFGIWGGKIQVEYNRKNGSGSNVIVYTWLLHSNKALNMLKKIYPFLRGKKDQAEVAIRFQEKKERMKRDHFGQWFPVPESEMEWREKQYNLLKQLKKSNL